MSSCNAVRTALQCVKRSLCQHCNCATLERPKDQEKCIGVEKPYPPDHHTEIASNVVKRKQLDKAERFMMQVVTVCEACSLSAPETDGNRGQTK